MEPVKSSDDTCDKCTHSGDVVIKDYDSEGNVSPGNYPNTLYYELLDEAKHYNSVDLVREINRLKEEIYVLRTKKS